MKEILITNRLWSLNGFVVFMSRTTSKDYISIYVKQELNFKTSSVRFLYLEIFMTYFLNVDSLARVV